MWVFLWNKTWSKEKNYCQIRHKQFFTIPIMNIAITPNSNFHCSLPTHYFYIIIHFLNHLLIPSTICLTFRFDRSIATLEFYLFFLSRTKWVKFREPLNRLALILRALLYCLFTYIVLISHHSFWAVKIQYECLFWL